MPAGMGEEERFAAAVENGTTPASHRWGDSSEDSLARELEIVATLRSGRPALGPDAATRERAKRRLMAAFAQEFGHDVDAALEYAGGDGTAPTGPLQVLAPVTVATRTEADRRPSRTEPTPLRRARAGRHSAPEPDPTDEPEYGVEPDVAPAAPDGPDHDNVRPLRRRDVPRGGPRRGAAFFGAAAAITMVALAGTGAFASQDALPGDPMYGVKRVAESTGYALTFSEQAKARRRLEQAQRRLDEVEGLVARDRTAAAGSTEKASDPELVQKTMKDFDTDTNEGSRLLLSGPQPSNGQVDEVRTWATQQSQRLTQIRSALPAPDQADGSLALLNRLLGETAALQKAACAPGTSAGGSASAGSGDTSGDTSGAAGSTAGGDACAPSAGVTARGPSHGHPTTTPDGTTSTGASATARPDDGQGAGGTAGVESDTSGDADSAGASARTPTTGPSRTGDADDRRKRNDDSGGGSGGSGGSGAGGSGDVNVPLPVPKVGVPSVAGLPGLSVGQ